MSKILVIGAVLLDITATYDSVLNPPASKSGTVNFSIGGAAFNVASNLVHKNYHVTLFTKVNKRTVPSEIIRHHIHEYRKKYRIKIVLDKNNNSSSSLSGEAFVGIYEDSHGTRAFKTGLTDSLINNPDLTTDQIENLINHNDIIVLETNLSTDLIDVILRITEKVNLNNPKRPKKILIEVVSENKATTIYKKFNTHTKFDTVSMNHIELSRIDSKISNFVNNISTQDEGLVELDKVMESDIARFCHDVHSRYVFITRAAKGYVYFKNTGEVYSVPSWVQNSVSDLGAGDAFFSALCATIDEQNFPDGNTRRHIKTWVEEVMNKSNANLIDMPISLSRESNFSILKNSFFILLLALSILSLTLSATFINYIHNSPIIFWSTTLLAAGLSGGLGTKLRSILPNEENMHSEIFYGQSFVSGVIAGIIAGISYISPQLAMSNNRETILVSAKEFILVPFIVVTICISVGLIYDRYIQNINKTNLP